MARAPRLVLRLLEPQTQAAHRLADGAGLLLRREFLQGILARQLDIDREAIGIKPRLLDQGRVGIRNRLEVDVAAKTVLLAQHLRDPHQLLHRVVGRADDPRGQKQPLDVVAAIEVERQPHDLLGREARPLHVAGDPVHAIKAVVDAMIGEQQLQERDAAAVRRIGMTDAVAGDRADAACLDRVLAGLGTAGGTGGVVFRRVGQDREFRSKIQPSHRAPRFPLCSIGHEGAPGEAPLCHMRSKLRPAVRNFEVCIAFLAT